MSYETLRSQCEEVARMGESGERRALAHVLIAEVDQALERAVITYDQRHALYQLLGCRSPAVPSY